MVKNPPVNARDVRDVGLVTGFRRSPGEGKYQPTPVLLPGESHGKGSLVGHTPLGHKDSDTTEATKQAHTVRYCN